MVREQVTALGTSLTLADVGIYSNDVQFVLTADVDNDDTVFHVDTATGVEANMFFASRGVDGYEVVRASAVDANALTVTVVRARDGTTPVPHYSGQTWLAMIPAKALNQLFVEVLNLAASGAAPATQSYLVLGTTAALTAERRFVPGTGLSAVDGGANGDYTLSIDSTVATLTGAQSLTNKTLGTGTVLGAAPTVSLGSDATGDIYYRNAGGVLTRLPIGTATQVLTVAAGLPSWATPAAGLTGSGVSGRLAYWDGASSLTSDADLTFDGSQLALAVQGATGGILFGGDAALFRGAANRLDLASGDSLNIVSGSILGTYSIGGTPTWSARPTVTFGSDAIGDVYYRDAGGLLTRLAVGSASQVLTVSGGLPSWQTPSAGGMTWTEVTGTTQSMAVDNGYIANNASQVVFTLPSSAAVGKIVGVVGKGSGGWRIGQNAGQQIIWNEGGVDGTDETTVGTGGYIESTDDYDSIELICMTANTTWAVKGGPKGDINLV